MSTCSFYKFGPTRKEEDDKLEKYREWDVFKKLEEILAKHGKARVYLVATSCGMNSPKSTFRKMRDFAQVHPGVRSIALKSEEWGGTKYKDGYSTKTVSTPALTAIVQNAEVFMRLWEEANKIRAWGCGCSILISDGQAVDVRVMDPDCVTADDTTRHDGYVLREWV